MKYAYSDFLRYTDQAPKYYDGIIFEQSGIEEKDVQPMVMKLRRLCAEFDLSYLLVTSNKESKKRTERVIERTGKKGRPKITVTGTEAVPHLHGVLINENHNDNIQSAKDALTSYFRKRRKKRPNLKRQKIKNAYENSLPIVKYMYRQMNETKPYGSGSFDFSYFNNVLYCSYPEEDF